MSTTIRHSSASVIRNQVGVIRWVSVCSASLLPAMVVIAVGMSINGWMGYPLAIVASILVLFVSSRMTNEWLWGIRREMLKGFRPVWEDWWSAKAGWKLSKKIDAAERQLWNWQGFGGVLWLMSIAWIIVRYASL